VNQAGLCSSQEAIDIFARDEADLSSCAKRQSAAHGCIQDRQRSNDCDRQPGKLLGDGALAGNSYEWAAVAMKDCEMLRVEKRAMMDVLYRKPSFSEMVVAYLLARNIHYKEDLVDQLFNSSEKRLARLLLLLAHFGERHS
jgi:hypothetical protein